MSGGIVRGICLLALLAAGVARDCRAEEQERDPLTRQEFTKKIFRGVPKADVVAFLGEPDEEKPGAAGNVEMVYKDLIIQPATGRREQVTIIIFVIYEAVGAVRWADGTSSATAAGDAFGGTAQQGSPSPARASRPENSARPSARSF